MSPEMAGSIVQNFEKEPFVFRAYPENVLEVAKAGDDYGNTFIHPTYIRKMWDNRFFHLESHLSGGLRGWQDIVVLKRLE